MEIVGYTTKSCGKAHPCCSICRPGWTAWPKGKKRGPHDVEHRRKISEAEAGRDAYPIGTQRTAHGRIEIKVSDVVREHKNNWRYLAHLVMEDKLGRPLRKGEIVHHRNEDTTDDDPENLQLCATVSEHSRIHMTRLRRRQR